MSEYQYYEFRALDRPLTDDEMGELRSISSRAEITPYGLTNEYHFGNFRGDPLKLMEKYFDAFLYYANWGTHRMMLRVPLAALAEADVKPYLGDCFNAHRRGGNLILDFHDREEEPPDEWEDGFGWLATMLPLRTNLLQGDLRALYLGWLAGLPYYGPDSVDDEEEDDTPEPPVPAGLRTLTPALRQLAEFLYLDEHLLEVAVEASGDRTPAAPAGAVEAWVAGLPAADKDGYLARLLRGEGVAVAAEVSRRFLMETASPSRATATTRTVTELLRAARDATQGAERRRAAKAAREKARQEKEAAERRAQHLAGLVGKEEQLWAQVEASVAIKLPKEYDKAVEKLNDLHDLAEQAGTSAAFATRLRALRERHATKRTFLQRLDKAGLPA